MYLVPLQNRRSNLHILKASVRARPDHDLIDGDGRRDIHDALRILGQMRERDDGTQCAEVDLHRLRIACISIGSHGLERLCHASLDVRLAYIVIRENAVLRPRLDRHIGNRQAVGHGE